jgi:uncharacterized membrane protein
MTPNILDPIGDDPDSEAEGVSPGGTIYGASINGEDSRAASWGPGITDLSTLFPGQTLRRAYGADSSGRIILQRQPNNFLRYDNPGFIVLPTNANAQSVSSSGWVTGYDWNSDVGAWHAFRWTSGSTTKLSPIPGDVSSWGWDINDLGVVVGISSPTHGYSTATSRATYWPANSTNAVDLGTFGGAASWAAEINNHNDIVGFAHNAANQRVPFLRRGTGGSLVDLRDLILPITSVSPRSAWAINDRGQIVVEAADLRSGTQKPVVMRLTPLRGLRYEYWQSGQFSSDELNAGQADELADPDHDGIRNIFEWLHGLSPTTPHSGTHTALPHLTYEGSDGRLYLTFRRTKTPTDAIVLVERNEGLDAENWTTNGVELFSATTVDKDYEDVTYRTTESVENLDSTFLRVRVER